MQPLTTPRQMVKRNVQDTYWNVYLRASLWEGLPPTIGVGIEGVMGRKAKIYKEKMKVSFGWSRPFMVKQIFPYGAVEITLLDGTNAFKARENDDDQLKYKHMKHRAGQEEKKVECLAETKTKLAEIQTVKQKKKVVLIDLSEKVESVAAKSNVVEHQKVDRLEVVAEEFSEEIERISPLEPSCMPEEPGLVSIA
ncbi:hypothetical protein E5676_scaffold83G001980 [Cucumis melo var. makuwa]|uniref:Uncharacterized protein n=1 Tax=Cucumis melo var. makuwa TaxID=1194695 RepID=A0A5D3C520_CUCMM|nr:hypothetical protein E5676_scaffold83G001980 [Cucumis melo var. makuwa]